MAQATFTDEAKELFSSNPRYFESASLRHKKFTCIGDNSKKDELEAVCEKARLHPGKPQPLTGDTSFPLRLGGRMMVNMAGGILENAGLCLHPFLNYPMIPGSALKGIARHQAWLDWGRADDKNKHKIANDLVRVFGYPTGNRNFDECFKRETNLAGAVAFLQAVPASDEWQLVVDVLTPHGGNDYSNPIPNFFLAVERGAEFLFSLKKTRRASEEDLGMAAKWLRTGLCTQGAGAKSAAGYGWFLDNPPQSTIQLKLTTPGFFAGASHDREKDTQLRIASLRGMLRWWWRTLYREFLSETDVLHLENQLWGSASGGDLHASQIVLRLQEAEVCRVGLFSFKDRYSAKPNFAREHDLLRPPRGSTPGIFYLSYGMDDGGTQRFFVEPGGTWNLQVSARNGSDEAACEQARVALSLLCRFGGIGSKSRKGFGSLHWPEALTLEECRKKAREFCQTRDFRVQLQDAAYSFKTAIMAEISVKWSDPWTVLDRLGLAVQKFAQDHKHDDSKAVLGLPRKIHGPRRDPMRHQRRENHQRPCSLEPNLSKARNGKKTRFASPVFYHVEPAPNGSLIRITAFPSDMIRNLSTSKTILEALLQTIEEELVAMQDQAPEHSVRRKRASGRQGSQPSDKGARHSMAGGIKAGQTVKGRLAAEKTKKGGWKVELSGCKLGPIVNTQDVPSDKQAGDEVEVIVQSANPKAPSFQWPG